MRNAWWFWGTQVALVLWASDIYAREGSASPMGGFATCLLIWVVVRIVLFQRRMGTPTGANEAGRPTRASEATRRAHESWETEHK